MFSCWNSISDRRIAQKGRAPDSNDPTLTEYFEIVSRNVYRARVRLALEKYRGLMVSEGEPRDAAGNIINEPSDDELLPQVSEECLRAQQPLPVLDLKWNTVPNPSAPERDAQAPLAEEPDPQDRRVDTCPYSRGDLEFLRRHAASPSAAYLITAAT